MMKLTRLTQSWMLAILVFQALSTLAADNSMIRIPGGKYRVGLSPAEAAAFVQAFDVSPDTFALFPMRKVEIEPFLIDRHEVTNAEYKKFVDATGHPPPVLWVDYGYLEDFSSRPVTGVLYRDAVAYTHWAGKRLPTEEEWEIAARGEDGRLWPWGNKWQEGLCVHAAPADMPPTIVPSNVATHPGDRSPFGVFDMAGNVTEWVASGKADDRHMATVKGGSFVNSDPYNFLCAALEDQPRLNGFLGYIGFRCARDAEDRRDPTPAEEIVPLRWPIAPADRHYTTTAAVPEDLTSPESPETALRDTSLIRILPVGYLPGYPPGFLGVAQTHLCRSRRGAGTETEPGSFRFEIQVPYLSGQRFNFLFENLHPEHENGSAKFHNDHTSATVTFRQPSGLSGQLSLQGGLDYVDVDYEALNDGTTPQLAYELCFQPTYAPHFRDHDGTRTWLKTEQGFVRRIELWHHVNRRMWLQQWQVGESGRLANGKTGKLSGPLIATVSRDGKWLIAPTTFSHPTKALFHNREYSCLHNQPQVILAPGEQVRIAQRVYFLRGGLNDLVKRYEADKAAWMASH